MKREGSKLASKIDQEYRRKKQWIKRHIGEKGVCNAPIGNIEYKIFKITKEK